MLYRKIFVKINITVIKILRFKRYDIIKTNKKKGMFGMEKRGLSRFQLKVIALVFMTLDHTPLLLGEEPFPYYHIFSRFVGVLFGFLLVDGFFYTSNKKKYLTRLIAAAVIMSVGNHLIAWITGNNEVLAYGIFSTLASGFAVIWILQWARFHAGGIEKKMMGFIAAGIVAIIAMMYTEGGFIMIPMMIVCYLFHEKKLWIILCTLAFSAIIAATSITYDGSGQIEWELFFGVNCQWAIVTVIPFILLYSGRPGKQNSFSKWMFYIYYPAHIWVFTLIGTFFTPFLSGLL